MRTARVIIICACVIAIKRVTVVGYAIDGYAASRDSRSSYSNSEQQTEEAGNVNKQVVVLVPLDRNTDVDGGNSVNTRSITHPGHKTKRCKSLTPLRKTRLSTTPKEANASQSHYVVEPMEDRRMVLMRKLPKLPNNVDGSGESDAPLEGDEVVFMDGRSSEDQRRKKYVCYCMEDGCTADHPRRPLGTANAKKRLNSRLLKNKKCTPCQADDPTKIPIPIGQPVVSNPFQSTQGYQNPPHGSYVGYSPLQSLLAANQQRALDQNHNVVYDDSFISPSQSAHSNLAECVRLHGLDYCLSQITSGQAQYRGGLYQHRNDVEERPVGSQWNQLQASTDSSNLGDSNLNFYSTDFTNQNCEHGAAVGQQHSRIYPPYQQIPIVHPKYLGYDEVYGNYNHAAGVTQSPLGSEYTGYHDGRYDNYLDDRAQTGVVDSSTEYIIKEPEVPQTAAKPSSTSDDYEDGAQEENQLGKSSDCYTGATAAPAPAEPLPASQPGEAPSENFEYSVSSEVPVTSNVAFVGAQPDTNERYNWETTPMHEEPDYDAVTETADSAVVRSSGEFTEPAPSSELGAPVQPESTYHGADLATEQPPAADLRAPLPDILQEKILSNEVVSGDIDADSVVGGTISEPPPSMEEVSKEVYEAPGENTSVSYDEYPQGSSEEIMATSEPAADYDVLRDQFLGASSEEDHGDHTLPVATIDEPIDVPQEMAVPEAPTPEEPKPEQPAPEKPLDASQDITVPTEAPGAAPIPEEAAGAPAESAVPVPEETPVPEDSVPTSEETADVLEGYNIPSDYPSSEEATVYLVPEYTDSEESLVSLGGSTPAAANVPSDYEDVAAPTDYLVASVEQVSSKTPVEVPEEPLPSSASDSEELASPAEPQEPVVSMEEATESPIVQPEQPLPSSEHTESSQEVLAPIVCTVPSISDEKYLSELQTMTGLTMEENKLLRAAVYQAITELASNAEQHLQAMRTFSSCDIVGAPEPALIQGLGDLPIIRDLFNVPLVRQLAVGTVRSILTQLTGVAEGSSLARLGNTVIDAALRTVIGGGEPLGDVEEPQLGIVNANVASVPDIILSTISSIISRPAIGIQGARNPGIQNIIVNTLANIINKARHLVDNSIIWDALHNVIKNGFDRLPTAPVLPKPSAPVLPKPSAPVLPKPSAPVLPKPSAPVLPKPLGPSPIVQPPEGETKPLPYIPVTEHFIQDGEWYEGPATIGYKGEFPEPKGAAAPVGASEPEELDSASEEPIQYHSPEDIVLTYIKNHPADQGHSTSDVVSSPEDGDSPTTMHHLDVNVEPVTEEYIGEEYDASEAPLGSQEAITVPALAQSHEVTTERVHKSYTKTRKYYSFSGGCSGESALGSQRNPTYLGRLTSDFSSGVNDIEDLEGSDLYYVGDGVRLPLTIKRMSDGSFALSLSDRVCESYVKENCPCCVPKLGHVVQETTVEDENGNMRVSSQKKVHSRGARSTTTAAEEVTEDPGPHETTTATAMPVQKFAKKYNLTLNLAHSSRDHQKTAPANAPAADPKEPTRNGINIVLGFRDTPELPDTLEENQYVQDLLSIHDIPEQQRAAVVINALDGLLNSPADDWPSRKSESGTKPPGFEYQVDNPIMERLKQIKHRQLEHGSYKYQHPDEAARVRTEAAKNILHWLKELVLKAQEAEIR